MKRIPLNALIVLIVTLISTKVLGDSKAYNTGATALSDTTDNGQATTPYTRVSSESNEDTQSDDNKTNESTAGRSNYLSSGHESRASASALEPSSSKDVLATPEPAKHETSLLTDGKTEETKVETEAPPAAEGGGAAPSETKPAPSGDTSADAISVTLATGGDTTTAAPEKTDAPKPDGTKPEEKAPDAAAGGDKPATTAPETTDAPKPDGPKPEEPKPEEKAPEAAAGGDKPATTAPENTDAPKTDAPKTDSPKPDDTKPEEKAQDAAAGGDTSATTAPEKADAPKPDGPKPDEPKLEEKAPEAAVGGDKPATTASETTDAPKLDDPKPEEKAPETAAGGDKPAPAAPEKTEPPKSGEPIPEGKAPEAVTEGAKPADGPAPATETKQAETPAPEAKPADPAPKPEAPPVDPKAAPAVPAAGCATIESANETIYTNLASWLDSIKVRQANMNADLVDKPVDDKGTRNLKGKCKPKMATVDTIVKDVRIVPNGNQLDTAYILAKVEVLMNSAGRDLYGIKWGTKGCGAGFVLTLECGYLKPVVS